MATDADNARVWGDGAVFKAPHGTTAPTDPSTAPAAAFVDLGFISEDGIEVTIPDSGDTTVIRAWQGRATLRIVRAPSDDLATYVLTFSEHKKEVIETYFGVTVNDTDGSFEYTSGAVPDPSAYIFDYVDGAVLNRDYVPRGVVTSAGSRTINATEVSGYQVTITAEYDTTAGYDLKSWSTALVVTP